jgi:hypothetical protein
VGGFPSTSFCTIKIYNALAFLHFRAPVIPGFLVINKQSSIVNQSVKQYNHLFMKQSITQKMTGRWKYLLFICIFMLSTLSGFADHLRYGSLTWQRVPGNPLAVKFTIRNAFRLSLWTDQNLSVTVGGTIQTGNFKPGQGGNLPVTYTVTAINVKDDWWFGEYSVVKTYTAPGNYNAFYNSCCRIIPLQNNSNAIAEIPTLVQVGTGFNDNNDAPNVITAPIVNFPRNKSLVSLKIPAADPNGDALTFSLTPVGQFGTPSVHPAAMSVTTDGWLTWNTIGKNVGEFYNTSVRVTDAKGAFTTVDFLIKIVDSSAAPSFDYVNSPADGSVFNLQPGENITFHIKVTDPTTGDTVILTAVGLPPGATFNTTGTNPVDGVFGWTPTPDQQGTYVVTFISQDTTGVQNSTTVNFNVGYKPYFDIPTTPGNNSIFSVKPGDTLAHIIKAKSLDTAAKISLAIASGYIPGMTFNPTFPLTPANPVSTNFKWVPQASDWGVKRIVYVAEDTFRHQPVYDTIHYIVDNPPVITSTPDTTIHAGQTYSYVLSATDLDLIFGDKLKVENITLPSFLSIVNNNNNTWTISGTPGAGDVGVYTIVIEVADSMNHVYGTHDGNAFQVIPLHVLPALNPLTATGIVTDATIFGTNTGAINLTPAGGAGPYTYMWSNSATTEDLSNIPAGTYVVTITDAANTIIKDTFVVGQPAQLTVAGVVSNVTIFGGNNGVVDITPAGGVGTYTYVWSNTTTTQDLNGVVAGTYSVTVTDANGATATGTYTVAQPAQLTATAIVGNATIFNTNTGSIDITPAGGVGPYTYVWSNNATTQDLNNIGAGTYTVNITDANGATYTASYTVSQPAQLTVAGVVNNVTIFGGNNGAVDITPAGGVGTYTYAWSNTATTQDLNGVVAGTYSVTVTDANGATATGTYTVAQPAQLTATATVGNATIFNTNTGSIDITPAGGVGPYTYVWSNNATTQDLNNIGAGTYTVNITDANGATYTSSYTVSQPAQLTVAGVVNNVTIFGGNNGVVDITPAGGVGTYTYAWSNTATTQDLNGVVAGTYSVTVTDANGATATGTYTVAQPAQLTATATVGNATIFNTNTGSIDITPAGGVGPYTYVWSNNATTQDLNNIGAGTYTVNITDANGATYTSSYTVSQPAQLTVSGVVSNVTIFNGNNGAINITAAGGVGPYTYVWNNNSTVEDRTGLIAGTYSVTVTDANGATATGSYTITQPTQLTVSGIVSNVTIFGGNNGAINITAAGGVGPYTYVWNNNSTVEDRTGLIAGTYSVTITDANNATATATFTVTQPAQLAVTGVVTNVTTYGGNNGTINITATGGVGPYTYLWNNNSTVEDRTGLIAGTYSVTLTDANNATATATFTVTQPTVPLLATLAVSPVYTVSGHAPYTIYKGYGSQSVTMAVSASGGAPGYTYQWSPSTGLSSSTAASVTASPNATTTYTVVVKDANNNTVTLTKTIYVIDVTCGNNNNNKVSICHKSQSCNHPWWYTCGSNCYSSNTICVSVNSAATHLSHGDYLGECFDIDGSVTNVACNGSNNGSISLVITGGAQPYTFSWSNNATTQNLSNLTAGTYTVNATSADGRVITKSFTVNQPSVLNATAVVSNACYGSNNGSINLSVSGGSSPYTYLWNNNSTSQDRNNLSAGTYSVVVTDNKGCSVTKTFTVTQPSAPLALSAALTHVSCNGGDNGAIDLSVSGGAGPYTYNWNLGGSNSYNNNCYNWWWWWCNNNCNNNNNSASTQDVNGLEEGNYSVTVTDANGCTATGSYTINEPTAISVNVSKSNVTCKDGNNGTITLSVSGGTAPYSYNWGNNITTQNLNGLTAGNYNVTVTDSKGCTKSVSTSISQPSNGMNISASVTNVSCKSSSTGSVNLSVNGGSSPYSYSWTGGATTQDISNKPAGTYNVTITDHNGCSVTKTYTITEPATALSISAVVSNVSCKGGDNGAIDLSVAGGNGPYTYNWNLGSSNSSNNNCYNWWWWWCNNNCNNNNNTASTQDVNGLEEGNYSVTVTDANGCSVTASYTITEPTTALSVSGSVAQPTCAAPTSGAITLTVSGGGSSYTYSWSNGSSWSNSNSNVTTKNRTGLSAGNYTVKVTDNNGCTTTETFAVNAPVSNISASISVSPTVTVTTGQSYTIYKGYGQQYVTLSANVSGGNNGYSFSWSPSTGCSNSNSASTTVSPNSTTTYTVTITSSTGCTKTVSKTIVVEDVRCGNNDNKVLVCRNNQTKCINENQVASYLNNGYQIGECSNHCKTSEGANPEQDNKDLNTLVAKDIKVYPNPSNGVFMIELPEGTTNANVIITDMNGRIIERKAITEASSLQVNMSGVAQGMYLIQVATGTETYQSRITIK